MTAWKECFRVDALSVTIAVFVGGFLLLTVIYSTEYMHRRRGVLRYYAYLVLTAVASLGVVFADNLLVFVVAWGLSGLLLYLLINFGETERAPLTAKKAFIIIGGSDSVLLLGLALVWHLTGRPGLASLEMSAIHLEMTGKAVSVAYLCFASAALAKAGAMPFHTWVPDMAEDAPTPVTAYLPASLDKLLGIYLFVRISTGHMGSGMFVLSDAMSSLMMFVGSVTIVAAVMMALVQHDFKRLLGYHAVSQVGYMVLGVATGNPIGIAGGLFHLLNNALYKSALFYCAGAVEKRAGTTDLDRLGGLAKVMPITFGAFMVAALAISGVPPLNGFASKWMIYQGLIEVGGRGGGAWVLWLVAAMFGSALTLASFMKLAHAVFLGRPSPALKIATDHRAEVRANLWLPPVVLSALCLVFGIFAYRLPLKLFVLPSVGSGVSYIGDWHPVAATALLVIGLGVGVLIYLMGAVRASRTVQPFVGGETLDAHPEMHPSGVDFYRTVQDLPVLSGVYLLAEKKFFDLYEVCRTCTFAISKTLGFLHNGVLPRYLAWCLLGMLVLFYVLGG